MTLDEALRLIQKYEENGPAKLYYSLNRKMWEMADLLNSKDLKSLDIQEGKDKSFERLKVLWNDASALGIAVKTLGDVAGITGDEKKDIQRATPVSPQSIAKQGL